MKTRNDIYAREAAELLRVIADYRVLLADQAYRLFPGREKQIHTLIGLLRQQARLWVSDDGRFIQADPDAAPNDGTIKAMWILLDFIDRVDYHCSGNFPVNLSFFLDEEFYEIIDVPPDQKALICQALSGKEEAGKRIIIVEDPSQIERLDIPGASGFCTVSSAGVVQYYQRK